MRVLQLRKAINFILKYSTNEKDFIAHGQNIEEKSKWKENDPPSLPLGVMEIRVLY
jgi:hypothetical protein